MRSWWVGCSDACIGQICIFIIQTPVVVLLNILRISGSHSCLRSNWRFVSVEVGLSRRLRLFGLVEAPLVDWFVSLLGLSLVIWSRWSFLLCWFLRAGPLPVDEEVADDVDHGLEGLRLGVLLHQLFEPQQPRQLVLRHRNFGTRVLSHKRFVRLVEPVFLQELADQEARVVLRLE